MIQRLLASFLTVILAPGPLCGVQAATIEVATQPSTYASADLANVSRTVRISGPIERGDADTLLNVLLKLIKLSVPQGDHLVVAEVSGPGGDYYEAMKLGQLLRDFRVVTLVRKGEKCLSACVLTFLGGSSKEYAADGTPTPRRYLEIGGMLAFRNYYTRVAPGDPTPNYPTQSLIDYSVRMGVDHGFGASLSQLAPGEYEYIDTVRKFFIVRVCPIGLPPPTASLAVQATNICTHGSRWFDPEAPSKAVPITALMAKRFLLEAARRNTVVPKGDRNISLVRKLTARTFMQSDAATDELYADLKAAGVSLPDMGPTIFEVSGHRTGAYRLECIVSFAADNPDKHSVVIMAPVSSNLAPMLQAAVESCPGLSGLDRNDVINPRTP